MSDGLGSERGQRQWQQPRMINAIEFVVVIALALSAGVWWARYIQCTGHLIDDHHYQHVNDDADGAIARMSAPGGALLDRIV
jgi:hypothetical protein